MKLFDRLRARPRSTPTTASATARPRLAMALEPRFLLDAAAVATGAEAAADQAAQDAAQQLAQAEHDAQEADANDAQADVTATPDAGDMPAIAAAATGERREIVFIDANVSDHQQLAASFAPDAELVVLDPTQDGLAQMAAYLQGRQGIDAIHVLSHGNAGSIALGSAQLDLGSIAGHGEALGRIGAALSADGDLLFYGCNIAGSADGQALVQQLAQMTGADIAASTDETGRFAGRSDWELEYRSGDIEADIHALGDVDDYQYTLAPTSGNIHTYGAASWANSSLVTGADGNFYLAYKESSTAFTIKQWNGTSWNTLTTFTTTDTDDTIFGEKHDLAIDANGHLHLVFRHADGTGNANDRGISYGFFDGATWSFSEVDESSHPGGSRNYDDPKLAVDADGNAHLIYRYTDSSTSGNYLRYATNAGGSWLVTDLDGNTGSSINEIFVGDIAIAAGNINIFYIREDNQNEYYGNVYHASKALAAGSWSPSQKIIDAVAEGKHYYYTAFQTDAAGNSYIASSLANYDTEGNYLSSDLVLHTGASGSWTRSDIVHSTTNDNYVSGLQIVGDDKYLLVQSWPLDGSAANVVMMADYGSGWITGDEVVPQSGISELVMSVNAAGQIMLVMEDGGLLNLGFTTGTEDDFGLIQGIPAPSTPDLAAGSDTGSSSTDNLTNDTTPTFTGTATTGDTIHLFNDANNNGVIDAGEALGTVVAAGGTWSITPTLAGGSYNIKAMAQNGSDYSAASAGLAVTIDTTAPAAPSAPDLAAGSDTGNSSSDNLTNDTTPTFTGSGAEPNALVRLYADDVQVGQIQADASGNWTIPSPVLPEGTYTFTARVEDAAGNLGAASTGLSVTIDTTGPVVSAPDMTAATDSGSSNSDNLTNDTRSTFTGTAPAGTIVQLFIDYAGNGDAYDPLNVNLGSTSTNGSGVWTITPSADMPAGTTYTVKARGRDDAGNFGAASAGLDITIDVTPPPAPAAPDLDAASDTGASNTDNVTSDTSPTFSGTTDANTPVRLYADGVLVGSTTSDGSGNWSITSAALATGAYSITARVLDAAGNESADSTGLSVTVENATPTLGNLDGDSIAWGGVGNAVVLDVGGNALPGDSEFGALNGGAGNWAGATLTVTQADGAVGADVFGFDAAGASFTVNGAELQAGGNTFATFTNTGGVLTITFTGAGTTATTALVSAVAQRITYRNDTPAGDATIRFSLSDGNSSGTADVTVTSDIIYVTNATDTATINPGNGVSFSEAIAIAAADSTGSQTIVFASNLAGQTIALAGNIALTESLTLNLDAASNVIFSGGTLTIGGGTTLTLVNGAGDTAALNTTLAGTGNLAKTGAGTLWLGSTSNNSGWSGGISVTGGTLAADSGSRLSSGTLTLNDATLAMTVPGAAGTTTTVANAVVLGAGGGVIAIDGGGGANIAHFSGTISGGELTKTGAAILQLSGNNTYTGTTTVEAGTLAVASDADLGAGAVNLGAGTTLAVTGATTIDNAVVLNGGATLSNSAAVTLAGAISGAHGLTKAGAGDLTLSGANNYAGTTTIDSGTLYVGGNGNLGSGDIILNGGRLGFSDAGSISRNIQLTADSGIVNADSAILHGNISGAYNLTKYGSGSLALNGTNNYANTTVAAGALAIANDANLGSGSISLAGGTILAITAGGTTIDNAIALTGNATVQASANTTLSGAISGSHTLTKSGASTLTLTGISSHTGGTIVNAGTLSIASDGNLGAGTLTLAAGTTLTITGATTVDNAIALSGNATVQATADATLSGAISGTIYGLTKTGAAQLTLSGTNTYIGNTTVAAGTLFVSGSTAGMTLVNAGATLAGTGTLGGAVTIGSGGTLSPGDGAGTLTVNGNLTLQAGSTLAVDIDGTTAGAGYDQIVVNGAVNVSGATLAVTHGYAAGQGDTYTFIVNDAADAVTGTFSGLTEGGTVTAGGNGTTLTASYIGGTGNDLTLTAPINQAPTVGSLNGDSRTFTQGGGAVLLDANGDATVADADSADFAGGNITVATAANGVAGEDVLGIRNQGTGAGQIGAADGNVTYGGVIIGTYTGGSAGADLVITLNGAADAAAAQALIRNLTYANSNATNDIGQAARTVRITVNDGDGGTSANADVTVAVVETVAPTVIGIEVDDTALAAGETTTVTITFSEAVTGLTVDDFMVQNGALSNLTTSDNITWTATLAPNGNVQDSTNLVTLNNAGVIDAAGNAGAGTTSSNNYAIDTLRPTATIAVTDTTLAIGETTTVTITFSEAVSGLTADDFTVANGALSGLNSSDGGVTWTATLSPTAGIANTANVIALDNTGVTDAAGNAGMGSTDSNNYAIDTVRPTASIVVADTALKAGQTSQVTITFSEAVTGLAIDDFSVANGALSNLASTDGITWTATLTPAADVSDTSSAITLDNAGYADAAGNTGLGTTDSNPYAIETVRPTAAIVVDAAALAIGQTAAVTITFSEAVTGLTLDDFSVAGGALSNLASADGITWTATLTPAANIASTANVITLDTSGVQNGAGNAGAGTTESNAYAVDTAAPTATVATGPGRFIITFSEAVAGVDANDFVLTRSGGALGEIGAVTTVDGRTYSIELTGLSGDGALALALSPEATITDLAGNAMTAALDGGASYTVASDFPPPLLPETPGNGPAGPFMPPPAQPSLLPVSLTAIGTPSLLTPDPSISGSVFAPFATNAVLTPLVNGGGITSLFANGYLAEAASPDTAQPAIAPGTGADAGFIVLDAGAGGGLRAQPDLGIRAFATTEVFSWSLPRGTFTHSDRGAVITVEARLADGRPLPAWLRFDPAKGTLSGKPPAGFDQKLLIEIVGRDNKGNRASTQLELDIRMGHAPQAGRDGDTGHVDRLAMLLRTGPEPQTIDNNVFDMAAPGFAAQLEAAATGAEREAAQLKAALERHLAGA